jgi:hypothetical protein
MPQDAGPMAATVQPTPSAQLTPEQVTQSAIQRLRGSPYRVVLSGVSCEWDHGMLFLRGRLASFFHKQLAQEAVAELRRVVQVVNEIEVGA